MIGSSGIRTIGTVDPESLVWPLDAWEAKKSLAHFLKHGFRHFGSYQDAMATEHRALFHSRLSFALNTKMLSPQHVVEEAIRYWNRNRNEIGIAQVEGFVRQILGWREYMRGVYWAEMSGFRSMNFFGHQNPLPSYYWSGKTNMRCMAYAIGQSLEDAYAHHIQRLMVTGNFALLAGIHPDQVDAWYLGIYIDALPWVELTNTRGMSQFADGGLVGTKPYVSTANYIDRMSDYCRVCSYDRRRRTGESACPFNSLYWDFYHRHRERLEAIPRIGFVYRTLDRMNEGEKQAVLKQARRIRGSLHLL
jgi:deoxyribodipyrimidine photolyase-related protein